MKVYVIMSNDYPAGVMDNEVSAEALVETRNETDKNSVEVKNHQRGRIYWRCYEFEMNGEVR